MPGQLFLELSTSSQGTIPGSVTQSGFEDKIGVFHTHHLVETQANTSSRARGRGKHEPLTIVKDIDKATVLLYNAWSRNERVDTFKLEYYRSTSQGTLDLYYTVELEQARITSIEQILVQNDLGLVVEREVVKFAYQSIVWTFANPNLTATASQNNRV